MIVLFKSCRTKTFWGLAQPHPLGKGRVNPVLPYKPQGEDEIIGPIDLCCFALKTMEQLRNVSESAGKVAFTAPGYKPV